jgi:hypothetical protein
VRIFSLIPTTSAAALTTHSPSQNHKMSSSSSYNITLTRTSLTAIPSQPLSMSLFGTLNRFISRLDAAPIDEPQSAVNGAYGFQVLRNTNQDLPLEPWFDFIIGINGRTVVSFLDSQEKGRWAEWMGVAGV